MIIILIQSSQMNENNITEGETMKAAKDLISGDKIKAGDTVASVASVRVVVEAHAIVSGGTGHTATVKYITIDGQPEIADWNLQQYIDQGSIEIL